MTDRVTFTSEPAAAGEAPKPETVAADRPAWLPEQFKTPEDLVKSYQEAQAKITQLAQGKPKAEEAPAPKAEEKPVNPLAIEEKTADETAKEAVEAAGIDPTPYTEELTKTGDISEESRDKIAKALEKVLGKDARAYVDAYVEQSKAQIATMRQEYFQVAGGEEAYAALAAWGRENFTKAEQEAYNRVVTGTDHEAIKLAIAGLKAKYEAKNGRAPKLANVPSVPGPGVGFTSNNEFKKALADPRYKTDPDYREQVRKRLEASRI